MGSQLNVFVWRGEGGSAKREEDEIPLLTRKSGGGPARTQNLPKVTLALLHLVRAQSCEVLAGERGWVWPRSRRSQLYGRTWGQSISQGTLV